jgi:hypothetical protein
MADPFGVRVQSAVSGVLPAVLELHIQPGLPRAGLALIA